MNEYRVQTSEAIRSVEILSPTGFSWLGKPIDQLDPAVRERLEPPTRRAYLLYNLQSRLYESFYCRGVPRPKGWDRHGLRVPAHNTLLARALSKANHGSGYVQRGWRVESVRPAGEGTEVRVVRGDLLVRAAPEDCIREGEGPLAPGDAVSIRFGKELTAISPTYYMAVGNRDLDDGDTAPLARIYFNVGPDLAPRLTDGVTRHLNDAEVPYRFKVVSDPAIFVRRDAAVLYVRRRDYGRAIGALAELVLGMARDTRPGVPAFTRRLAPGVSVAEQPADGDSFGFHRSGLIAEGLIRAHEQELTGLDARLASVAACFAELGLDLDRPYLEAESEDVYEPLPEPAGAVPAALERSEASGETETEAEASFLEVARSIGDQLAAGAQRHGGRCTWVTPEDRLNQNGSPEYVFRTLGPDLYAGTSGVGLFLAELYGATREPAFREVARGAFAHALARTRAVPGEPLGLYAGSLGVVYAAVRGAAALEDDDLRGAAAERLVELADADLAGQEFDLSTGSAGVALALLALHGELDDPALLESAVRAGEVVLGGARPSPGGLSWPSPAVPRPRDLLGYLHGASGIAHALLELYEASGDRRFADAARAAFGYERAFYDTGRGNWPDLRELRGEHAKPAVFITHWCHGAPGIALARARGYQLLGDERLREEAVAAIETTRRETERLLREGTGNFSLCHGLAGNAAVLDEASRRIGAPDGGSTSVTVGRAGVSQVARRGLPWPCGVSSGESPTLMLGVAGVGHFYLTLARPEVRSILFLEPTSARAPGAVPAA